jgi:putative alpha-1,2-mannosidase
MGPERYERRLDEWYAGEGEFEDSERTGRFGGAKGSSIPFCYHYVGRPWKAQRQIRRLLLQEDSQLYAGVSFRDSGCASALVAMHILGINTYAYGHPSFYIGTPLVDQARIAVEGGTFTIETTGNDLEQDTLIQSADLNGEPYDRSYLMHEDVADGGMLKLRMGKDTSTWASSPASRPYSVSDERWEPRWPDEPAGQEPPE